VRETRAHAGAGRSSPAGAASGRTQARALGQLPATAALARLATPQRAAHLAALQRTAGNAAVGRALRRPAGVQRAVLQRDALQPGDTAPQDDVDRAAGGRARSNVLFGRQCQPYTNSWEAAYQRTRLRLEVPQIVEWSISSPASPDAAAVWRRYLDGTGGTETHDGIADPSDRIAAAFAADERHAPAEDVILARIQALVPSLLPRLAGRSTVNLTLDELGIPDSVRRVAPYYDSDAFTIAANLAGGIGTSDFGTDSRRIDGTVTLDKVVAPDNRLYCGVQVRAEFDWTIRDAIDFCPGNAGNPYLQEWLTIPMSRLEATGLARDVGLLVRFRRVRYDARREYRNPDVQ
jgi:hypothetical protein